MNRLVLLLFMLSVVLSPLPLGSNREWSWTLCALLISLITLLWIIARSWRGATPQGFVHPVIVFLFLAVCAWVSIQTVSWVPEGWKHPIWAQTGGVLSFELAGMITLSAEDSWTALMRLLSYALAFFLAFQLALDRSRAFAMLRWLMTAGLVYGVFGLFVYWTDYTPDFLFGDSTAPNVVRSTFVNRNHFATWQGLALLCAISLFYTQATRRRSRPYELPDDPARGVERFILRAWKPSIVILLMTTALLLTHSRGGFLATFAAVLTLVLLLDSRAIGSRRFSRIMAFTTLAVAGIAFYLASEVLLDRLNRTDITTADRLVIFENVKRGIGENPALGFGYGTFADSFRMYDRIEAPVHYDRAHNTWLENAFELGIPASLALFAAIGGLAVTCWRGLRRRHRDWALPAMGVAATVLVAVHALVDFSLQIPAVAILYACIMGVACAQSRPSRV